MSDNDALTLFTPVRAADLKVLSTELYQVKQTSRESRAHITEARGLLSESVRRLRKGPITLASIKESEELALKATRLMDKALTLLPSQ